MKFKTAILFLLISEFSYSQWAVMNNGIGNRTVYSFTGSSGNIIAGTDITGGIYFSGNYGLTWTQTPLNNQNIFALASTGSFVFAGTQQNGVYRSTDNGSSWLPSGLNSLWITTLACSGSNIFAGAYLGGSGLGVYLSTNTGVSWVQTPLNNRHIYSLTVNSNYVFAGTYSYGLYISSNYGNSWIQSSLNNITVSSLCLSGNTIFAGTGQGVYYSTDNGSSWIQTSLNTVPVTSLTANGSNIFAGSEGIGVYFSSNSGTNWVLKNEGLGNLCVNELFIFSNFIFVGIGCQMPNGVYRRQLSDFVSVHHFSNEIPAEFSLSQNYPNPFNPTTNIEFNIPKSSIVNLAIFDAIGREVETLHNGELKPGTYKADWNAAKYPSGVYFYKLVSGEFTQTKKMVLVK